MTLIDDALAKQDNLELVRDKVAAILAIENSLTLSPPMRVYSERSNPWADWTHTPEQGEQLPLVNVSLDAANFDKSASSVVTNQRATATINLDCYGYGVSVETPSGFNPGDATASLEAQRAARLVRNLLMAAKYTYLDMRGVVMQRWISSINVFQPQLGAEAVQNIVGVRLTLEVMFQETATQVAPVGVSEFVGITIHRQETGEVLVKLLEQSSSVNPLWVNGTILTEENGYPIEV